ncbi:DUF3040 domain-containing protein [Corynebacterium aquilae]|uniref:DUF3040 domain-containing protein n=1 Tax=Corynebacterium aquilae DSM 44791 TaxID=1431546 RepID=A0A1L7CGX6_9CORY|nr:DUF3040 domain-containing protein [Corynebacterium aquilae]APT85097.1 hypothetical protein CAQU_08475 [Corynebacterium aquilae DSM 44791]
MALSEQEQRMLREIEAQLYADDPAFGGAGARKPGFSAKAVAFGLLGLVLLIGGIALFTISHYFMWLSVVGFVVMFGTGIWVLQGGSSDDAEDASVSLSRGPRGVSKMPKSAGDSGLGQRMEDNFRKRFEQ